MITIVSPQGPLPSVVAGVKQVDKDAAADICYYLSRVTGRKIAPSNKPKGDGVIIHVGRDAFVNKHAPEIDKLYADGYIVKCVADGGRKHIILAGKRGLSSWFVGEQFLKDYCGVRWLFPNPVYGEIVPSRPTIEIGDDTRKKYEPSFESRAHGTMYFFDRTRRYLRLRVHSYGGGSHVLQYIFSEKEFKAHPEWFPYFKGDGSRGSTKGWARQWWKYGNGWQICTTNPETVEYAAKYVREYFRKNPDAPLASVGHNDGAGWCECPECRKAGPPHERWWRWVNQVAREVAKTHPDKWVSALAYGAPGRPPSFPLEKNVCVVKTFEYTHMMDLAAKWAKVCRRVDIYSYAYGGSFLGFRHYPHAMRDFLKWGHDDLGARSHHSEVYGDWTFDGPKYHYMQALQWDVNADPDQIMKEFCDLSYGTAAKPMRSFWDRLEQIYERRPRKDRFIFYQWVSWKLSYNTVPNEEFKYYTMDDVEHLETCIKRAVKLAADDNAQVRFRIQRMAEAWGYVRTMVVSKLRFHDNPPRAAVESQEGKNQALSLAREIAGLRAERELCLGKLRSYPTMHPRLMKPYYWGLAVGLTIFAPEQALLNDLCSSISEYLKKSAGPKAAIALWKGIEPSDNLYESAQTQLYMLGRPGLPNVLANGDFETGNLSGWKTDGHSADLRHDKARVEIVEGTRRANGSKWAAQTKEGYNDRLLQRIAVAAGERYRLTAWVKHLTSTPENVVPADAIIEFYSGSKRVCVEPSRVMARQKTPEAGWMRLRSTVTIPLDADSILIKLTVYKAKATWDDVELVKIKSGPVARPGQVTDTFDGQRLDADKWARATITGGVIPPRLHGGWLVYDSNKMYPLVSQATFNDLVKHSGADRYCLRFHAAALPGETDPASITWGIMGGTGRTRTRKTGFMWTHYFNPSDKCRLRTYGWQKTVFCGGGHGYKLEHLGKAPTEVWYTVYFDPEYITMYASASGYDTSKESFVARYKHGMKDLTAEGNVRLKILPGGYQIDEISLTGPGKHLQEKAKGDKKKSELHKDKRLYMPDEVEQ
jgi:hypothetical protein